MKHCTSIEQSRKLLELGLNPESSDMIWNVFVDDSVRILPKDDWDICNTAKIIPCWSVGALVELMPESIVDDINFSYGLCVSKNYVEYSNYSASALYAIYHSENGNTILEACFEMIVWLIENGYIKTNK